MSTARKVVLYVLGLFAIAAALGAFIMFGPPGLAETIARPEFCRSCHIMEPQYRSYVMSPHGDATESCNDCHLPNDSFVRHWVADAFVGTRDLIEWNLAIFPEYIRVKPRSERWLTENCHRCHGDLVAHVAIPDDTHCWDCHRNVQHQTYGRTDRGVRQPFWEDR